jgi:hypothetical protein
MGIEHNTQFSVRQPAGNPVSRYLPRGRPCVARITRGTGRATLCLQHFGSGIISAAGISHLCVPRASNMPFHIWDYYPIFKKDKSCLDRSNSCANRHLQTVI